MMSNVLVEDILSISKALNDLDSAFLLNSAIVPTIQGALHTLRNAMVHESFVDSATTYHSEQYVYQAAAINCSFEHLTAALNDVQLKLSALKRLITSSTVVEPDTLKDAKEIVTAVHLVACGPQINWPLMNKALRTFAALITHSDQSIQSQQLLLNYI